MLPSTFPCVKVGMFKATGTSANQTCIVSSVFLVRSADASQNTSLDGALPGALSREIKSVVIELMHLSLGVAAIALPCSLLSPAESLSQ